MKTLLVLRHGKSSWSCPDTADHDRPLKGRGERDAKRIGCEIRDRGLVPDLIISSTALRARTTAEHAARAAGYEGDIIQTRSVYLTEAAHQLAVVAKHAGDSADRVMIVGHNPTSEDLIELLTGEDERITTANLACIDLDIAAWAELPHTLGELRLLLRPKEIDPK